MISSRRPSQSGREDDVSFDLVLQYLPELTYPTNVIVMSQTEIDAFNKAKNFYMNRQTLPPDTKDQLVALEARLDEAIAPFEVGFIKLEHHSPVDVTAEVSFPLSAHIFRRKLNEMKTKQDEVILWAWRESILEALAVRTGLEALRLLISSMRTFDRGQKSRIFVRQFIHHEAHLRFRCFVNNSVITAISQMTPYFHSGLVQRQSEYQRRLVEVLNVIITRLPVKNFIVDLNFTKADSIYISDLHPFSHMVHPGCFRWKDDKHLLEEGPLTLRVRTQPEHHIFADVPISWIDLVSERFGEGHAASRAVTSAVKKTLLFSVGIVATVLVVKNLKHLAAS